MNALPLILLALSALPKDDGYRGIWYSNQRQNVEYVYKYSGGLGTYCSSHNPFAIYRKEVNKTFFCYGGTRDSGAGAKKGRTLLHMVSYYDHATGTVPRPTILLDKKTDDAHDNPVISIDAMNFAVLARGAAATSGLRARAKRGERRHLRLQARVVPGDQPARREDGGGGRGAQAHALEELHALVGQPVERAPDVDLDVGRDRQPLPCRAIRQQRPLVGPRVRRRDDGRNDRRRPSG